MRRSGSVMLACSLLGALAFAVVGPRVGALMISKPEFPVRTFLNVPLCGT